VLELIPHDLEGNQCKLMALICLHMLTNVTTRNTRTQLPEPLLMLTQGSQIYDAKKEEEQEVLITTKEGGVNVS
jgi:hypothetical protein